jgi:hypothetical protein
MRSIFALNLKKSQDYEKGISIKCMLTVAVRYCFFATERDTQGGRRNVCELSRVDVHFELDGEKMIASYTNKGLWKETQKELSYDSLPAEVRDGLEKSKFADREIEDVIVLYLPGGVEQYRLKARKNDVEKKYLYFNPKGRLLRESVTF